MNEVCADYSETEVSRGVGNPREKWERIQGGGQKGVLGPFSRLFFRASESDFFGVSRVEKQTVWYPIAPKPRGKTLFINTPYIQKKKNTN